MAILLAIFAVLLAAVAYYGCNDVRAAWNLCRNLLRATLISCRAFVTPPAWLDVPRPRRESLPTRLLAARLRPFRVEATDLQTGLPRVFEFRAKHPGIVLTKAWTWGLDVTRIDELPQDNA